MKNAEMLNEIGNVNAININDFNTMQNLFKTNAHLQKEEGEKKWKGRSDERKIIKLWICWNIE